MIRPAGTGLYRGCVRIAGWGYADALYETTHALHDDDTFAAAMLFLLSTVGTLDDTGTYTDVW